MVGSCRWATAVWHHYSQKSIKSKTPDSPTRAGLIWATTAYANINDNIVLKVFCTSTEGSHPQEGKSFKPRKRRAKKAKWKVEFNNEVEEKNVVRLRISMMPMVQEHLNKSIFLWQPFQIIFEVNLRCSLQLTCKSVWASLNIKRQCNQEITEAGVHSHAHSSMMQWGHYSSHLSTLLHSHVQHHHNWFLEGLQVWVWNNNCYTKMCQIPSWMQLNNPIKFLKL